MTNGGLVAIRSNRSPAHRLEERARRGRRPVGDLVERDVEPGQPQRPLVDVGGDHRRRCAGPGAAPGRRSRCRGRATGRPARGAVSWASDVDAGLMPRTWSVPTRLGAAVEARGQVADDPQVRRRPRRTGGRRAGPRPRRRCARGSPRRRAGRPDRAAPARRRASVDGGLQQEQPDQRLERAAAGRYAAAPGWSRCAPARACAVGPSSVRDPVVGEVRRPTQGRRGDGPAGGRGRGHADEPRARRRRRPARCARAGRRACGASAGSAPRTAASEPGRVGGGGGGGRRRAAAGAAAVRHPGALGVDGDRPALGDVDRDHDDGERGDARSRSTADGCCPRRASC